MPMLRFGLPLELIDLVQSIRSEVQKLAPDWSETDRGAPPVHFSVRVLFMKEHDRDYQEALKEGIELSDGGRGRIILSASLAKVVFLTTLVRFALSHPHVGFVDVIMAPVVPLQPRQELIEDDDAGDTVPPGYFGPDGPVARYLARLPRLPPEDPNIVDPEPIV